MRDDCRYPVVLTGEVFVSYPSADRPIADAVVGALEADGFRCWYAPRDVRASDDWAGAIVGAINRCRLMILVFSEATNDSDHILREVRQAADAHVPILPFRVTWEEPHPGLQYYIGGTHWFEALTHPVEDHLERLVETVRGILADERESTTGPPRARTEPPPAAARRTKARWPVLALVVVAVAALAGALLTRGGDEGPTFDSSLGGLTWVQNPGTRHHYAATPERVTWDQAHVRATEVGGHLVSIGDAQEADWLYATFGGTPFWIGLSDQDEEGVWRWTSGEEPSFVRWCDGEPAGASPPRATLAYPEHPCWASEVVTAFELLYPDGSLVPLRGIIEIDE